MITVNNFITDLLDDLTDQGGYRLLLECGTRPRMTIYGTTDTVPGSEIIEEDELLYDLESLGVTGISDEEHGEFSFRYIPEGGQKALRFELSHYVTSGRLNVDIIVGKQHNDILTDLLENMEREKASDLILSSDSPPYYMVQGSTVEVSGYGNISTEEILAEMEDIGVSLSAGVTKNSAYRLNNGSESRFRLTGDFKNGRATVVFRIIPTEIKPLEWWA